MRFLIATLILVVGSLINPASSAATRMPDESRLRPATVNVLHYVADKYPEVPEIGGYRPDRIPDHPSGKALDIMVYGNRALGDRIVADLRSHKDEMGIRYILWQVKDHYDHLHVCVH